MAVPFTLRMGGPALRAQYDMMPDGRILGLTSAADDAGTSGLPEIRVVLNWFEELKGKLPK